MIKKLIALLFVTVNITLLSSQGIDKELYELKPIPEVPSKDIPLLFTFVSNTRTTQVYALTQTWIKIDYALMGRAKNAIEFVAGQILRKIKKDTLKSLETSNTCSYVLQDGWRIKQYNPKKMHETYFVQHVVDVPFQSSIQSKIQSKPMMVHRKLAPLNLKGLAHAKK